VITEENGAIIRVEWGDLQGCDDTVLLRQAKSRIGDYFAGTREKFDLPLRVHGSDFQRAVCDAMLEIPFGETVAYGDIAKSLNVPAQTVGQACGGNPIPLLIPCHRVLGANGLGGFSGGGGGQNGIEVKVKLLRHERAAGLLI